MSLARLVYYSAIIGGWSALLAWAIAEFSFLRNSVEGNLNVALTGGLVGGAIGAGLAAVAGMANGQWKQILQRMTPGLVGGGLGGAAGILLGKLLYAKNMPRAIGFMVMGLCIGIVEGVYERSPSKIRNGLIGGASGGLIGGFLFDPLQSMIHAGSGMSSRATAFVILGMCIGALIGLVQVAMKEAWLTVLDGYRAGRQLILSSPVTFLGRGDHLPLPFLGVANKDLESEHVRITRQPNGAYFLEDNHSRLGTRLNSGTAIQTPVPLTDGDVIKFGTNYVRFNERHRKAGATQVAAPANFNVPLAPPPPVVRNSASPTSPAVGSATPLRAALPSGTPVGPAPGATAAPSVRAAEPPRIANQAPAPPNSPASMPARPPAVPFRVVPPPPPRPAAPAAGSQSPPGPSIPPPASASRPAPLRPIVPPPPPPPPPRKG